MSRRRVLPMSAAERKQLQRAREADRARRLESLDTKRDRAQALADQLLASAQDLAGKLAVERNVSIPTRDIARYLIGLDGTEHVRAALEGKSVNLPPPRATETVTSNVTTFDYLVCNFCRKKWGEVDHMLIIAGRKAHGVMAVCNECSPDEENTTGEQADDVTDDVTQDDSDDERRLSPMGVMNLLPHDVMEAIIWDLPPGCISKIGSTLTPEGERIVGERIAELGYEVILRGPWPKRDRRGHAR
jgi:hypothetical protein